ncbi:GntR family transcriptional regulator [Streptomyces misionensis]|uniref:GntR family transcriptional regulator n=1 Tax=Streptomyces misionensis TaxID=67331 RepID=UPI0033E83B51
MSSAELSLGAVVPRLERPGPLRDRVYEALLDLILTHRFAPGRHLVESELAEWLGVSRQPVREALQRLSVEGWVELRPAQGAFVHEPTEDEVDQFLAVRALLETEAARLAARNTDPDDIEALRDLVAEGRRAAIPGDIARTIALDAAFHAKVMEMAGNPVLADLTAQVVRRVHWYCVPVAGPCGNASWHVHGQLALAITSHDEQKAGRLMREHTERPQYVYRQAS